MFGWGFTERTGDLWQIKGEDNWIVPASHGHGSVLGGSINGEGEV
jgi:hypothetical protein